MTINCYHLAQKLASKKKHRLMKKGILACVIASIIIGHPLSFRISRGNQLQQTSLTGKVYPADGADSVWVIESRDSVRAAIKRGSFFQSVKPGVYRLVVKARPPYRNASLSNVEVKQNHVLDVGELLLQK
jgi:hypothetical protein